MAQDTSVMFPWRDFALWLREGIRAAAILNKFITASLPEDRRPGKQAPLVHSEEVELLEVIRKEYPQFIPHEQQDHLPRVIEAIDFAIKNLKYNNTYFPIPEDHLQLLWLALTEYGVRGTRYSNIKDKLRTFSQTSPRDPESVAEALMDCIWRSLGPAAAPDRSTIK